MNKIFCLASALAFSSSVVNAVPVFDLQHQSTTFNSCYYKATNEPLDAALLNPGFFIVKRGNSEQPFFTRFGKFLINNEYYLVDSNGQYFQGVDPDCSVPVLRRIKINTDRMKPKATHHLILRVNFDANDEMHHVNPFPVRLYDAIGNSHTVEFLAEKISSEAREIKVTIDDEYIQTGKLVFNQKGKLIRAVDLDNILWQSPQGIQDLTFSFWASTQYASSFSKYPVENDGHPIGMLAYVGIGDNGEVFNYYTNGKSKKSRLNIAVAMFSHPEALENLYDRVYVPTKQSGMPSIKAEYSDGVFLPAYLQDDFCIPQVG